MKKSIRLLLRLSTVSFTLLASTGYAQPLPPAERMCDGTEAPKNGNGTTQPVKCYVQGSSWCPQRDVAVGQWYLPKMDGTYIAGFRCNLYNPPVQPVPRGAPTGTR
jgi:hypothetical protein